MPVAALRWRSAGHEATNRCEAIERLETDDAGKQDFEEELRRLIPQPGSSSETPLLRRLRELQAKTSGSSPSSSSTNFDSDAGSQPDKRRQSVTRERGSDGEIIETELYWSSKRLVWSRGGVVLRTFSYEEEVKCACWTWMDCESTWEKSTSSRYDSLQRNTVGKRKATTFDKSLDDASPLSNLQHSFRKIGEGKKSRRNPRMRSFRALCVLLPSCLVIYHPHSGQEYIKRLDLDVLNVFPLTAGLLIQRNTEAEDRRRALLVQQGAPNADPPLSSLFYLRRPYDELKGIECVDEIRYSRGKSKQLLTKVKESRESRPFNEVDEQVVMVSSSPPLLVSASLQGRCLRVYAYAHDRAPLDRYQNNKLQTPAFRDHTSSSEKRSVDEPLTQGGHPLARRSTLDGQRSRPGTRPRLPSRKSARLESSGSRPSLGGPRSSFVGDRTRTSSGAGHTRRASGGLNSIYMQTGLLLDEEEQQNTDEENIQEVMQLLDEFDEVEEDNGLQQLQASSTRTGLPGTVTRRRASRALKPAAVPPRTPFVKGGRSIEERRISRSRQSLPAGIAAENNNPVSLAMELSQKDEASKLAMTASGDKPMTRGLSGEGREGDEPAAMQGLSIFQEFAQGFAALSLLEEIPVADLQSLQQVPMVKAFIQEANDMTLLYLVLPFSSKLLVRQIVEQPTEMDVGFFTYRSQTPPSEVVDSQFHAGDAFVFHGSRSQDLLLTEPGQGTSLHLVVGPPNASAVSTKLDLDIEDGLNISKIPLNITSQGLLQLDCKTDPQCHLTATVLSVCERILSTLKYRQIRMAWIQSQPKDKEQEWSCLADLILVGQIRPSNVIEASTRLEERFSSLLSSLGEPTVPSKSTPETTLSTSDWTEEELANLIEGLNLVAQNARLDVCERIQNVTRLACLIAALSNRLGWSTWYDYWVRLVPSAASTPFDRNATLPADERSVFDVFEGIHSLRRGLSSSIPTLHLSVLLRLKAVMEIFSSYAVQVESFETMSGSPASLSAMRAKIVVEAMLRLKVDAVELRRLPFSLAIPLYQAINLCEREAPAVWSVEAYLFVGRTDLAKQLTSVDHPLQNSANAVNESESLVSTTSDLISSRLFPNDYRLKEVKEMLQTSRPIATKGPDVASVEDQDVIAEQQRRVFVSASDRTKSLSVGRGMFSLSTTLFKSTEQWTTVPICLRIRMLNNCIIQHREVDADSPEMEWPEFHNGVASALQLAITHDKIESSWLYSQLNKEFTPRHAGLMFGIGLLGQLRNLGKIHAHYYLSSRHPSTTIGLLLGISLSFLGSCDSLAKALMSIHLIHTLPTHSRPLKTSMLEQSAALVGLGFVFLASKDRWASRMAFRAIGTDAVMTDDNQMLKRECFSLSAAFSLGLTCLGQARVSNLGGEVEKEIVPSLEKLIKLFSSDAPTEEQQQERLIDEKKYSEFEWKADISLTTTPASVALAFIFLKSNQKDKAAKMPLPETLSQLDKIRPDVLMIRAICRSLIMWDAIQPTATWLNSTLPVFLQFKKVQDVHNSSESCQLAYWSLRVGSIFALGLKYAGSNDEKARRCLMNELIHFQLQIDIRPTNYFDKIRQQMLQSSVDIILTSLSLVLAGTGDIEVLQHLRRALYRVDTLRYGNYMAISMAIGMLFLGGGRFTLSTSDSAIAALFIAFYPRYPINAQDNRCHLQAYRHLWLLAVEARLLNVEDIESGESSRMPVEMEMRHGNDSTKTATTTMPCLLPKLQQVASIRIASDRYFASKLDLKSNTQHQRAVIETRKLYVKKRAADLSHDEDKWGKSSIRAQAGGLLDGKQQLPLGLEMEQVDQQRHRWQECQTLRQMIRKNTHDRNILVLVDVVCGEKNHSKEQEGALELFVLQSILECLLQDKQEMISTLISLYSSTQSLLNRIDGTDRQTDVFFIRDVQVYLRSQESRDGKNCLLPSHSLIDSLWNLIQEKLINDLMKQQERDNNLKAALQQYATSLRLGDAAMAWQECGDSKQRQHLACLLLAAEVPPFSTLLQLQNMVAHSLKTNLLVNIQSLVALMQSVLTESGFQTRIEVIQILIEVWIN